MLKKIFPVAAAERWRFYLLLGLACLTCFNYSLLRCLQDTLVIAKTGSGAAILPFLKLWLVLPVKLGWAFMLATLFRRFSFLRIFAGIVIGYVLFFLLFACVLYPNLEVFCCGGLSAAMKRWLPPGMGPVAAIVRWWPLALFYLASEVWKSTVLMTLFWGLANGLTPMGQGKRFYGLLMVGGSVGGGLAGAFIMALTRQQALGWDGQLFISLGLAVAVCGGMLVVIRAVWHHDKARLVHLDPNISHLERPANLGKSALLSIGLLLVADYLTFTVIEVLWKEQLWLMIRQPQRFCHVLGQVMVLSSLLSALCSLFLTGYILRRVGWTVAALAGPLLLLLTGSAFFMAIRTGSTMVVVVGLMHNCLGRACRQAFTDPARELAYIPLPPEQKTCGKAYVDGVSPTLGRTAAALLQQGVLLARPSLTAGCSFLAGLVGMAWMVWVGAILSLRQRFSTQETPIVQIEK